jgi:hypothetical protein
LVVWMDSVFHGFTSKNIGFYRWLPRIGSKLSSNRLTLGGGL